MPTYEWMCSLCGEGIEEILSIKQYKKHTNKKCTKCKKGKMEPHHAKRTGGFILSGDGWPGKGES